MVGPHQAKAGQAHSRRSNDLKNQVDKFSDFLRYPLFCEFSCFALVT